MKKSGAIIILENHLEELNNIQSSESLNAWLSASIDYAKRFCGKGSQFEKEFNSVLGTVFLTLIPRKGTSTETLNSMISYIKNVGLPSRDNFLQHYSNEWVLGGIGTIILITFAIGFYFGAQKFDRDSFKNLNELMLYKDSVSLFKSRIYSDSVKYHTQQPNKTDSGNKK